MLFRSLTMVAAGGAGLFARTNATVTIVNDDSQLAFAAAAFFVNENDTNAVITVARQFSGLGAVSVGYFTALTASNNALAYPGAGPAAGFDYTNASGTLSWSAGDTNAKTFPVGVIDNLLTNSDKTVGLFLTNAAGGAALGLSNATLTILDNESGPGLLQFAQLNFAANEAATNAVITVVRTNGRAGAVSVQYATASGTALAWPGSGPAAGFHFTNAGGTLTWADGDVSARSFTVGLIDNTAADNLERSVLLALSAPAGGAALGARSNAVLRLLDNDSALAFTAASFAVQENAGVAVVSVARAGGLAGAASVSVSTTNSGSATEGLDFVGVTNTLTWADQDGAPKSFTVPIIFDGVLETAETVALRLFNPASVPAGGAVLGTQSTATVSITDVQVGSVAAGFGVPQGTGLGVGQGADGTVWAVGLRTNGQMVIAGDFTNVNGVARTRVARLNVDGSVDLAFDPGQGPNDSVRAMAVLNDGRVLLGGFFTAYNGISNYNAGGAVTNAGGTNLVSRILRLTAAGALDFSFTPGAGADNTVHALALSAAGQIVIGGDFTLVDTLAAGRVARLSSNGVADAAFNVGAGPDGSVLAVAVMANGQVVAGGQFTNWSFGGTNYASRVARVSAAGALDVAFTTNAAITSVGLPAGGPVAVRALALQTNGQVVAGGNFTVDAGAITHVNLTRLLASGAPDSTLAINTGPNNLVRAVAVQPDQLILLAGDFTTYDSVTRNGVARLNTNGTHDTGFGVNDTAQQARNATRINSVAAPAPVATPAPVPLATVQSVAPDDNSFTTNYNVGFSQGTVNLVFNSLSGADGIDDTVQVIYNGVVLLNATVTGQQTFNVPFGPGAPTTITIAVNPGGTLAGSSWSYSGTVTAAAGAAQALQIAVGGDFTLYDNVARQRFALLNAGGRTGGVVFNSTAGFDAAVNTVALYTNAALTNLAGKWIAGGDFTLFGGAPRVRVARLNADGTLDPSFAPAGGANAGVLAVAVQQDDGKVLIAGAFTTVNGVARNRIARLNVDGTLDTGFLALGTGPNNTVEALLWQPADGKIIIAGQFGQVNGTGRNYIARLNGDGTLDLSFAPGTGADNIVRALAFQGANILIGGDFTSYNTNPRNRIARINSGGGFDGGFNPGSGADGEVRTIAVAANNTVVIGGDFLNVNGTSRVRVARLASGGALDAAFNPGAGADGFVSTVALYTNGQVFVAGAFASLGGSPSMSRIGRLNADGSIDAAANYGQGANNVVNTALIRADDNKVLIGGAFTSVDGTARNRIALLNDGVRTNFNGTFVSVAGLNAAVNSVDQVTNPALPALAGKLYAGGAFTTFTVTGPAAVNGVARFNLDGTLDAGFAPATGAAATNTVTVRAVLAQPDGRVLVGGVFTNAGAVRTNLARLNSDGSLDAGFNAAANVAGTNVQGAVNALARQADGKVIAGGAFTNAAATNLVRLNSDGSLDGTFAPPRFHTNGTINALLLQPDGRLVVGGAFTNTTFSVTNLVRLNTDGSLDTTFRTNQFTSGAVLALALNSGGQIYIGGSFTTVNNTNRGRLARLNSDGSLDLAFTNALANNPVNALSVQADGRLVAGGAFTTLNGATANRIGRLNPDASLDAGFNPAPAGTGANNTVNAVLAQFGDGRVVLGGAFTTVNGVAANFLARLNGDGSREWGFNGAVNAAGIVTSTALPALVGKLYAGGGFTNFTVAGAAPPSCTSASTAWPGSIPTARSTAASPPPPAAASPTPSPCGPWWCRPTARW